MCTILTPFHLLKTEDVNRTKSEEGGGGGEEGRLDCPSRGASLPKKPVSQYRCVSLPKPDDNDRTHENDANALS